ncbi:MAG: zinc ribbon domain-containing protein [Candidatus Hodarchaeota archaeon]
MVVDDHNFGKEDLADTMEPESPIQQEMEPKIKKLKEASVSELISFSKFTLSGVAVFVVGLGIQAILQQIQFGGYDRWVLAIMGVTILFLFGGLVIDILNWRDYTEWGALGAISAYFGVILIFITFPLNIFWYGDQASAIYIWMWILGAAIMFLGFNARRTGLDKKIEDQFFIFKEWVKAGGIRQALLALKQLIGTIVKGFFRYIWLGIKELGTSIKRFSGWIKRFTKFLLGHIWTLFTETFPNLFKQFLIGLWNNLHWLGLISAILYLIIVVEIPFLNINPMIFKTELMVIVGFFFVLGVLYPQRDHVVLIAKRMRTSVLTGMVSAYSMLSGTRIKADESVFCSRCLRGVETREFKSLVEIKGMINPPCPFCGFDSWIGSEQLSIPNDKLELKEKHAVQGSQNTAIKDTPPSEMGVTASDEKVMKKGKFPDYQSYQRAQDLGVRTYSELEYIDRLGAPDLVTANKIIQGGFSHFETYNKALAVGASSASEFHLVEELNAPDLETTIKAQKGGFPDYPSYQRAQDLGVSNYSELREIDRLQAPNYETAKKMKMGKFPDYSSYLRAQDVGALNYSELKYIEGVHAPDFETAKKIRKGGFTDFQTYQKAQKVGASSFYEFNLVKQFQAPNYETAQRVHQGKFPDYSSYKRAQNLGASNCSELEEIDHYQAPDYVTVKKIRKGGFPNFQIFQQAQEAGVSYFYEYQSDESSELADHSIDTEVEATFMEHKVVDTAINITEFRDKVDKIGQSLDKIEWNLEWRNWFLQQTEQYQKAQISETIYKNMLTRILNQNLQPKDTHKMQAYEKQALYELKALIDAILTGKTKLIPDRTPKVQVSKPKRHIDQEEAIQPFLRDLLKVGQQFSSVNEEITEWYSWFHQQIDLFLKSQLEIQIFKTMLQRSEAFLLGINTDKIGLEKLRDYEDILSLIHAMKTELGSQKEEKTALQTAQEIRGKECPSCGASIYPKTSKYCRECGARLSSD